MNPLFGTIAFLVVLLHVSVVHSERLPIKLYATADGLPNNEINKIVRDSRGFLWFCTADGISRFDGYAFTNYGTREGLPHPYVNDLLETSSGEYWVATNGGLVRFIPRGISRPGMTYDNNASSDQQPMFSLVLPNDADRFAKATTTLFEDHNGTIWCGTMKGLERLEKTSNGPVLRPTDLGMPREFPEQSFISDVIEDPQHSLWIAAPSGLYRRWPDGSVARYTMKDGLPAEHLHDLLLDKSGRMWAASRSTGFFSFTADQTHKTPVVSSSFSVKEGLPAQWVFQLFASSDSRLWIATSAGLAEFLPNGDGHGNRFHSWNERNGLNYHDITALNEDNDGNLWLGSYAGAMKLAANGFTTYDQEDGLDQVFSILRDRSGEVCFRGEVLGDGSRSVFEGAKLDLLHRYAGKHVPRYGCYDGQNFDWFMPEVLKHLDAGWVGENVTLQSRTGEWWLGTGSGLFRFGPADKLPDLKTAHPIATFDTHSGLSAPQVFRLFEDSLGDIWVSTIGAQNGLARWDRSSGTLYQINEVSSPPLSKADVAHSFGEDGSGNVWIGFSSGLARYRQGKFTFFTTNEGLPSGGIAQIHVDTAGRLWLASSRSGLIRVDQVDADHPLFVSYTTSQGLSSNLTTAITESLNGHIFVGTGRGLDELNPINGRIKHYTTADGLVAGSVVAAFCDPSGALWFGTPKGLSRFVPRSHEQTVAPAVLITRLSISGQPQRVSALGEREMSIPDISASQNQIEVDFVGLSFVPGDVLRYQYKFDRSANDWSEPSEQRTVNFANLASGTYTLIVRAVNSEGEISPIPATLRFTILPHFWQRWWFIVLTVLILGLIAYALYRYRMQKLIELERVRTRIATDLHDEIGSNLSLIAMIGEVARKRVAGDSQISSWLATIAGTSRESVDAMSDIVWAVDPGKDRLADLTQRMRRVAEDALLPRDITLEFKAPGQADDIKLDADTRREVFMIFKEALNNIVRHSQCTTVTIDFRLWSGTLLFEISDDGRGFDKEVASNGNGLANMQRRAAKLRGELDVISKSQGGTIVRLESPVDGHRRFLFGMS